MRVLVLARGRFGSAAARVLDQVRRGGPLTREEIGAGTGLSPATVSRTTTALLDAGVVRERLDLARPGTVGRPTVPVELDPGQYAVLGVHVGRRVTTVGLVGLDGRVVAESRLRTEGSPSALAAAVVVRANVLLSDSPERIVLAGGLTAPWTEIEYDEHEVADRLSAAARLTFATAHHVAAVAAAEFLGRRRADVGCTAYVYVRDTAGFALASDLPDRTEISRVATLSHFPTRTDAPCPCGQRGCLLATASDEAVAERAAREGVVTRPDIDLVLRAARAGDAAADQILRDRADVLGRTVAALRDMVAPDQIVLVGQAFTGYPPALDAVVAGFDEATTLAPMELSFTRFGTGVQAASAGAVGLGSVFADPLALVGDAGDRPRPTTTPGPSVDVVSC